MGAKIPVLEFVAGANDADRMPGVDSAPEPGAGVPGCERSYIDVDATSMAS